MKILILNDPYIGTVVVLIKAVTDGVDDFNFKKKND